MQGAPPELAWQSPALSRSLVARVVEWAHSKPDHPALICQHYTVRYSDLLFGMQAAAAWLHARGVRPGDTVAYALARDAEYTGVQIELFCGLAWLGAVVLPLYAEVPAQRHASLAAQFGARWRLTPQATTPQTPAQLDPAQYVTQRRQWWGKTAPRGDASAQPLLYEFTSGTTGTPKAMCFTSEQCVNNVLGFAHLYQWQAPEILVPPLQWPSKVGIRGLVRALTVGIGLLDEPFPNTWNELATLVDKQGATFITSSPWQVRRLLASRQAHDQRPTKPFGMGTGGAPIAVHEIQAARDALTPRFHVVYGTTELGAMTHLPPEDAAGSAMRLVTGMACEALDAHGTPLPPGHTGQLRFRAPWLPSAYAHPTDDAREGFQLDWFVSSDMGTVSEDGRVTVAGRSDDAINVGGSKVQPQDVEHVLLTHPDIADAAVVGVPDTMAGEISLVFLVLRQPVSMDALTAFLSPRLDAWQMPAAVLAVGQIPRNPEGKILREPLRSAYAQLMASQSAARP